MSSKTANIGLLFLASLLATGQAVAQPGVKVSAVSSNGTVTTNNISVTNGGPGAKAPTAAPDGSAKYWDGLGIGGTSTNYFTQVPYITATPNPQIAAGPDDILTIVNRTLSRYPNPNAAGNTGTLNPYNYPPTEFIPLDVWMGLTVLGGNNSATALCPSGTGSNSNCVIDNASIRYDQMQGRFIVLFTVTDLPAHRSNWVLVVSSFSQFVKCPTPAPAGALCPLSSPLFTPPVIAPIVGGTQTGGVNPGPTGNWYLYTIPINLLYNQFQQPSALGLVNNLNAPAPFNNPLANSAVGTPNQVTSGGSTATFLTTPFCPNGGPLLPLTPSPTGIAGGTTRTCTNYYPTGSRFGIDNDNIILTAPVLDQAFASNEGKFPSASGQNQGPYAGTRVTSIAKLLVYNGTKLNLSQPGPGGCTSDTPVDCQAVNLADNTATGTLTAVTTKIAFGQGLVNFPAAANGDLQYGGGTPNTPNSCVTAVPVAVVPTPLVALPMAPANTPAQAVLSCAPIPTLTTALPAIFWEPDNLRGRALASFDSQVAPFGTVTAGTISPIDYLVGTEITDNLGFGIKPQGVPGATGQPGPVPGAVVPATAGIATIYYLQSIAFSCPGSSGLISDFTNCFAGAPGGQSVVADLPFFGPLFRNVSALAQVADPSPVGQGFSATQMTTNPANTPVTSTRNERIFVGDSRPEQVLFREGLLYVARNVRLADQQINWLGTSTVLYDILKTCATGLPGPACGSYSITGAGLTSPALAFEYEWFNGLNVPDPAGNVNGFGFYQPMFEVPADVVATGPVSPISTLQLFDKLFIGMTTGGTINVAANFSENFPSLWDFRPGDDAYDTTQPYLDPYSGSVSNTYNCFQDVTVTVSSVTNGSTITVSNPSSLQVGMFLSGTQTTILLITGNMVVLSAPFTANSFPATATFTFIQPITPAVATRVTPGSSQILVASTAGLQIGQILGSGANAGSVTATFYRGNPGIASFGVSSLTNVGLAETVSGAQTDSVTATISGAFTIDVPFTAQVAKGELVVGTGIPANTAITGIGANAAGTAFTLTLSQQPTVTGTTSVRFDTRNCFAPGTLVQATFDANTSGATANTVNIPGVKVNILPVLTCTDVLGAGLPTDNGLPLTFTTDGLFPAGTTIINIVGNTVNLSNPAANPLPGLAAGVTSANLPLNFITAGSIAVPTCPLIPFSPRGGASTDPNDGSLWLYGEFARNRLSTIPGPGQWGTSVANYALSFPAVDPYGNDNTYFQDVQPSGSPQSAFFTWIQLAKNLGLAVPSATGPCTINNGVTPILQPPASGGTPTPGTSQLGCPYFGPDTIVTRAEMAYWVVRSQMDEAQITNYLCATGGDPTGTATACNGAIPAYSYADFATILNPFLGAQPSLGIQGVTLQQLQRYIEVMIRRGYTKGCGSTIDPQFRYCPNDPVTRAQMSVFLIRAKMNNVFPTSLSGLPLSSPYGDNFGTFLPPVPYFSDVTQSDPTFGPYYIYIQKMRELRIANGIVGGAFAPGNNLTRKEIATFVVRAFFL